MTIHEEADLERVSCTIMFAYVFMFAVWLLTNDITTFHPSDCPVDILKFHVVWGWAGQDENLSGQLVSQGAKLKKHNFEMIPCLSDRSAKCHIFVTIQQLISFQAEHLRQPLDLYCSNTILQLVNFLSSNENKNMLL